MPLGLAPCYPVTNSLPGPPSSSAAPTTPPDGQLYMAGQTTIPCNVPGGVQQTLVGPAAITLIVYSLGMPIGGLEWEN